MPNRSVLTAAFASLSSIVALASIGALSFIGGGCIEGDVPVGTDEAELLVAPPPAAADLPICETYCNAAQAVDCPRGGGDCLAICAAFREESPGCHAEADAFLACAATVVDPDTCNYRQPNEGPYCIDLIDEYDSCSGRDESGVLQALDRSCNLQSVGISLTEDAASEAYEADPITCDIGFPIEIGTRCESGGLCTCTLDGDVVHTCTNLVHTIDFSHPVRGCCAEYFDRLYW